MGFAPPFCPISPSPIKGEGIAVHTATPGIPLRAREEVPAVLRRAPTGSDWHTTVASES